MTQPDLHIVAGLEIEGREVRREERKRAAPMIRHWLAHIEAKAVDKGSRLKHVHVQAAKALTNFPSANQFYAYPSQARIGSALGCTDRWARQLLADLVREGYLRVRRGGPGRTATWFFCIGREALADLKPLRTSGLDRNDRSYLDRKDRSALDRNDPSAKPYEPEPVEPEPVEHSGAPSPPPTVWPRAREAREIADEVLSGLTPGQRKNSRWKGLARWIAAQLEQGAEALDLVVGIGSAIATLKGEAPSSFSYFVKPIERAKASRLRPLPGDTAAHVSAQAVERELCRILGLRRGLVAERLGEEGLASLHRRYMAGEALSGLAREVGPVVPR